MVKNYTKDLKESIYHSVVVSALAIGYTMLGKATIKMIPWLSKNLMLKMI